MQIEFDYYKQIQIIKIGYHYQSVFNEQCDYSFL